MNDTAGVAELTPPSPLDCEATMRRLWDYLDGTLDTATMGAIDAHLADCEKCRGHLGFESALLDRLKALRQEHEDVASLRARVTKALADAGHRKRGS